MTNRTRYFVVASLLVLTIGLGTGLLAYYVGLPAGLLAGRDGPDELKYVPRTAAAVAYADVGSIMVSGVRQTIRRAMPQQADGQRQFQEQTGIDIESDIDYVVASLQPGAAGGETAGLVLARGRFSDVKIEALMRQHGAVVADYNGQRVIARENLALAFLEPGLVAVGSPAIVRGAIDLRARGENVTANTELMELVRAVEPGNAWAVGRFDALMSGRLPAQFASRLPAMTWFSISGRVDSEVQGVMRAQTRDEQTANDLRDVVRGFLALAKLQAGSQPQIQTMIQSLELGGTGNNVALSFSIPAAVFDMIGASQAGALRR